MGSTGAFTAETFARCGLVAASFSSRLLVQLDGVWKMTDKELIELAAKAAGYDEITFTPDRDCGVWSRNGNVKRIFWNPLTDDGDALRLAVELSFIDEGDWPQVTNEIYDHCGGDWFAATRRAITRAAAQIGKEME